MKPEISIIHQLPNTPILSSSTNSLIEERDGILYAVGSNFDNSVQDLYCYFRDLYAVCSKTSLKNAKTSVGFNFNLETGDRVIIYMNDKTFSVVNPQFIDESLNEIFKKVAEKWKQH